jgi:hypothetical protein
MRTSCSGVLPAEPLLLSTFGIQITQRQKIEAKQARLHLATKSVRDDVAHCAEPKRQKHDTLVLFS